MSLFLPVLLAFLCALCFFLIARRMLEFIQGWLYFDDVILLGTRFSMICSIVSLKLQVVKGGGQRRVGLYGFCVFTEILFDAVHICFCPQEQLASRESWSKGHEWCIVEGDIMVASSKWRERLAASCVWKMRGLRIRSRVLSFRVRKSTICSNTLSSVMSRMCLFMRSAYWCPLMVSVGQSMSGALN